ncbi:Hepatocyte Growth Factor-Like Protein [Manis pentadactyla]|nr:Hepatocyte Growth Factor-Like Protein [Manis pentadactyla]
MLHKVGPCLHEALPQDRKLDEDPYTPHARLETDPGSEKKEAAWWNGEVMTIECLCCHVGLHFQAWSLPLPHPHSHPWEDMPTLQLNVPAPYAALGFLQVTS